MPVDVVIPVQELTDVASARRESLSVARRSGLDTDDVNAVGIVVTEAATNLIKHGGGGEIVSRKLQRGGGENPILEIIATDRGKGMADPVACFKDGYSTAGSLGAGLGAIARLSLRHRVYSIPGSGTVLVAQVGKRAKSAALVDVSAISLPYPGEEACGDAWVLNAAPNHCRLVIVDGLGHGVHASEAANAAVEMVKQDGAPDALTLVEAMHDRLRPTRGAAVAIADIDFAAQLVAFTGVGNIAGSIIQDSGARHQMVSMNGTVGHQVRAARIYQYPLPPGSLVILSSDGLTTHWQLDRYPGLLACDVSVIAAVLMRDFRRARDDATVVVVRAAEFSA